MSFSSCFNNGVSTCLVFRLAWSIWALDNSKIVTLVLLPDLISCMAVTILRGRYLSDHVVEVSNPLVSLGRKLQENKVTESSVASSWRSESVHWNIFHSQSSLDVYTCKSGNSTTKRVASYKITCLWVSFLQSFDSFNNLGRNTLICCVETFVD